MSTFGKILAFLNVIVAIVFLIILGKDHAAQQSWSRSELYHRYFISGLPVDVDDKDERDPSEIPASEQLSPGILKEMFAGNDGGTDLGAGNAQVKTVSEELQRVAAKIRASVTSAGQQQQRQLIRYYLLPLARTIGERQELSAIIDAAAASGNYEKALTEIDFRFAQPKMKTRVGEANRKEIRARAAHLLVCVNSTPEWRKRVMAVVGIEAYIDGLERQADSFEKMAGTIQQSIALDQKAFEIQHAETVEYLLGWSDDLYRAKDIYLKDLQKTLAEREAQVKLRDSEKNMYDTRLTQARAETTKELAKLAAIQKDLYDLEQKLVLAIQRNQDLESDLRKLEIKK